MACYPQISIKYIYLRVSNMAQWVKELATKPKILNLKIQNPYSGKTEPTPTSGLTSTLTP